jgi:MtN3 and saliva related transmembrane protein
MSRKLINNSAFIHKFTTQIKQRNMESYLGFLAAFCTTIAFIPQVIKVYKSKHTKDISLGMFLLLSFGILLWIGYGLMIKSYPVVIANAITIILSGYILIIKIKLDVLSSKKN